MYQVLGRISETNAPLVFKGALITKLILAENGFSLLDRQTVDIDANWISAPPSMEVLVNTIQKSLGDMQNQFYAVAIREYEEKKSAGMSIRKKGTDEEIMSMDISVKPVIGSRLYHYGEADIRGVLANEILADKITVLSGRLVFRRAKDLIDIYALTHCIEVRTSEVFCVLRSKSALIGEFTEFFNRRDDVEHAYDKLQRIEGKPPFDDIYSYLTEFVRPFATKDKTPRIWNAGNRNWIGAGGDSHVTSLHT
ncbi:MAG: nucleotidyl transferase AbiEii/AbiGii toxin family protein [Oscillospiraceae bacterium]|nr:nucleotidyl transferase AbiEii/AbiGii toxin family protein [Oscillospiraceae bacterium]